MAGVEVLIYNHSAIIFMIVLCYAHIVHCKGCEGTGMFSSFFYLHKIVLLAVSFCWEGDVIQNWEVSVVMLVSTAFNELSTSWEFLFGITVCIILEILMAFLS